MELNKKNSILFSTYNGEKYLKQQLDSLYAQTDKDIQIIARDDDSTDKSLDILKFYNVDILPVGKNIGAKDSFSSLLEYAVKHTKSEYFMFCDQDDVWFPNKIELTIKTMQEIENFNPDIPILIHTDLRVVNESLEVLSSSYWDYQGINPKYDYFNRLLVQNTITGCTMMINRQLAKLCLPIPKEAIMHDWWIGLVASKFGKIVYLDKKTISYRQHKNNRIGAKKIDFKYIRQLIFKSDFIFKYTLQAKIFLSRYRDNLDKNTINMLENFSDIKNKSFLQRRIILLKYGIFKQGFLKNLGLLLKI